MNKTPFYDYEQEKVAQHKKHANHDKKGDRITLVWRGHADIHIDIDLYSHSMLHLQRTDNYWREKNNVWNVKLLKRSWRRLLITKKELLALCIIPIVEAKTISQQAFTPNCWRTSKNPNHCQTVIKPLTSRNQIRGRHLQFFKTPSNLQLCGPDLQFQSGLPQ